MDQANPVRTVSLLEIGNTLVGDGTGQIQERNRCAGVEERFAPHRSQLSEGTGHDSNIAGEVEEAQGCTYARTSRVIASSARIAVSSVRPMSSCARYGG